MKGHDLSFTIPKPYLIGGLSTIVIILYLILSIIHFIITYQHVGFRLPVGILENLRTLKKLLLLQVVSELTFPRASLISGY